MAFQSSSRGALLVLSLIAVATKCLEAASTLAEDSAGFDAQLSGRADTGRHLLQGDRAHRRELHHIHGWLMCLAWGFLIPLGVLIAAFRSVSGGSAWWFYLHIALQTLGYLVSLAGVTVGAYLTIDEKLQWQHRVIGITVTVAAGVQILLGLAARPKKTRQLRRYWNITHWTLGRAALALAIANIFIGMYISHLAYKNIIAQAVVLGGLFIIYMLKQDIDYLAIPVTPQEEERLLTQAYAHGKGKGQDGFIRSTDQGQLADSARSGVPSQASGQQTVI